MEEGRQKGEGGRTPVLAVVNMIELLFPPQWTPTQPYLGMACLAGYVREKGLKIRQRDVNALFYDHVLSKPFLEECREIVQLKFETLEKEAVTGKEYKELVIPFMISDIVVDSVEKAKKDLKSEKSLDLHEYLKNFKIIQNALLLIFGAHSISPSLFDLGSLCQNERPLSHGGPGREHHNTMGSNSPISASLPLKMTASSLV